MNCAELTAAIVNKNAEYQDALAQQTAANAAKQAADNLVNQRMMELQYLNYLWQQYCQGA